jgi:hypothetical protein
MNMNTQETELLGDEIEMLMTERANLLKVVGAAAMLIAHCEVKTLPDAAIASAESLSEALNALSEETLQDALHSMHS